MVCHFVDDRVMPGTLMYECCLHTLRIFLMRMGWVGEQRAGRVRAGAGRASRLRCRGPGDRVDPEGDLRGRDQGAGLRPRAVRDRRCPDVRRRQADRRDHRHGAPARRAPTASRARDGSGQAEPARRNARTSPARSSRASRSWPSPPAGRRTRSASATGRSTRAGSSPACPAPPYSFLDRIVGDRRRALDDGRRGRSAVAEYDMPPDAWYFAADRQDRMPFAVLLEAALQPCGWLGRLRGLGPAQRRAAQVPQPGRDAVPHRRGRSLVRHAVTRSQLTKVTSPAG